MSNFEEFKKIHEKEIKILYQKINLLFVKFKKISNDNDLMKLDIEALDNKVSTLENNIINRNKDNMQNNNYNDEEKFFRNQMSKNPKTKKMKNINPI